MGRQAWAISVDPDQKPQNAASDQGSTLFANHPTILHTVTGNKKDLLKRYMPHYRT